jgi:Protein of unknown function (DUF2874).
MKKTIVSAALALIVLNGYSQEKKEVSKSHKPLNVPEVVKQDFAAQYPKAVKVKWSLEKPGEYEAEFNLIKTEMAALYDAKGVLIESETKMKESELPQAVRSTLAKDFAGYKIAEVEKADAKGVVSYEMEAKKGKKEYELVFDKTGKLLKQEAEKGESKND